MGSDNMIQLRSVLQFKIMNMVQSILNSSLVKFLIFYQLQNTVVYPLILPSRITPSEIQKIVINRALLMNFTGSVYMQRRQYKVHVLTQNSPKLMYECSFSLIFT